MTSTASTFAVPRVRQFNRYYTGHTTFPFGDALRLAVQRATAAIFAGVPLVGMVIVCQWVVSGGSAPFQPVGRGLVSSVLDTSQPRKARSLLASSRRAMVTRGRGRRCDEAADRLGRR
jgi:hypothetical protein